jgi:hypothetical protein
MRLTLSFERQATTATSRRRKQAQAPGGKLRKGANQKDGSIMHQEKALDNYFETFYFLPHRQLGYRSGNLGCITSQVSIARQKLGTFQAFYFCLVEPRLNRLVESLG